MIATSAPTASRSSASTRGAVHARVAPAAGASQIDGCGHAQRPQRGGELADAIAAELIRAIDGELGPMVADDFALLAEGAGDDAHLRPAGGVMRYGGAVGQALVVGMCVDEQQPGCFGHGRTLPVQSVSTLLH